ncbi:hypothetical protein [Paenibacillus macerans]|uniref:hypothetical protein n=1 Tax=Paenibacillus macerans TaxID=44252 RepID=UPI00203FA02E|nr:hypothetical protein [Paenibacillus macerans]MCM3703228.1 hypothetical protein [Paenibacillus macerans]
MAGKKGTIATKAAQTKAAQEAAAAKVVEAGATVNSYPLHELMAASETLLGVKPEVLAGAVAGAGAGAGTGKEMMQVEMQVDEAKRLVKQFLGKKVL